MEGAIFLRDEDTIPSLFSMRVSLLDPAPCIKVKNFGQVGYNHENEVVLLRQLLSAGARPDVVIFYDGANDVWHRVFMGQPHMAYGTFDRITSLWEGSETLPGFFETAIVKLARRSALIDLIRPQETRFHHASAPIPDDLIAQRASNTVGLYCGNLNAVGALGREYGFQTLTVLQPILFLKNRTSEEEVRLLEKNDMVFPSLRNAFLTTYRMFSARFAENPACGEILDLSNAFDATTDSVFLDSLHLSPLGNRIVAEALAADLSRRGWMYN